MQETNKTYAGYFIRMIAASLDALIWLTPISILLFIMLTPGVEYSMNFINNIIFVLTAIIAIATFKTMVVNPLLISKFGGNVGKLCVGLKIKNQNDTNLTYKNALFRESIAKIASSALLGVGYFWILRNPQKQAWHDMLAGTFVYKKNNILGVLGVFLIILFLTINTFIVLAGLSKMGVFNSWNDSINYSETSEQTVQNPEF